MEKYDNIVKGAEIRKLVSKKMYLQALKILETIDVDKVKVVTDLSVFAEVYMQTEHYEEAKELLLRICERSTSRRVIYQLIRLAIKMKDIEDAEVCYEDYLEIAPNDYERYILRYRIDKMKGEELPVLIASLEELKKHEYIEKWAYELAKLYHKAGMVEECIRECSDIILWFGEGIIVEKARMLKEHYVGNPIEAKELLKEKPVVVEEPIRPMDDLFATKDLAKISKEVSAILEQEIEESALLDSTLRREEIVDSNEETGGEIEEEEAVLESGEEMGEEEAALESGEEIVLETAEKIEEEEAALESGEEIEEEEAALEFAEGIEDDELEQIFESFYEIPTVMSQLQRIIRKKQGEAYITSLAIAGTKQSGKTTLAKKIVKAFDCLGLYKTDKIAKIGATKLNQLHLKDTYTKLQDSAVIIEDAHQMDEQTSTDLIVMLKWLKGHIIVILEDSEEGLTQLYQNYPVFKEYFPDTIAIPAYGCREMLVIAKHIIQEKEYEVEEEAKKQLLLLCKQLEEKTQEGQRLPSLLSALNDLFERVEQRALYELTSGVGVIDYSNSALNKILASDIVFDA